MTTFTSRQRVYDFLKFQLEERYCQETALITNDTGADIIAGEIEPGYPLKESGGVWSPADTTEEGSVDGFYVDTRQCEAIANSAASTKQYAILVRGPALVNVDAVPVDTAGAAFVRATLITRMKALSPPIIPMAEPTTSELQTS